MKQDRLPEGNAIVYCEGSYNTTNGKTAHGLVRFTQRYKVISVVDSRYKGQDAGMVLDGKVNGLAIVATINEAIELAKKREEPATHLVIGLAPDGGRLNSQARQDVQQAIRQGLNIDIGLHDFLSEDSVISALAAEHGVVIRDIRKPPTRDKLHFFSGKIEQVTSLKVAVLGTDSAVGKRTTAWLLVLALRKLGHSSEMIGTGQTGWMQGARYSVIFDSLVNDFVSGEIEHAVWSAWQEAQPEVIVVEGQGSLMNPAYPGGFEILAAARPDIIVLQHAPARREYDGFPGYPIHPLAKQIQVLEQLSSKPVVAITINHEDLVKEQIPIICESIQQITNVPTFDVLLHGAEELAREIAKYSSRRQDRKSG